jgi:acetyltransferase-like isoleucine patch superfamily enzyme
MKFFFYFILITGLGNVVLRPGIENPFTHYQLVAPIGAVVTKSVPLYAIVAGNPARFNRYRFGAPIISRLATI